MVTRYVINTPLINYFFYNAPTIQDGPNVPLAGGKLYFFDDADHSVELPTYSSVFDPNNPVVNTNPVTLGAAGECPIFYLEDRLYFITIYDANNVFQRSISHYNPGESSGGLGEEITNYISNGQFRLHNDLPAEGDFEAGELREAVTDIAYGGWTANIPEGSTSKNFVNFIRYNEWTSNPQASPRYALNFICTDVDTGDAFKDIRLTYNDVNKFANTNSYTVSIAAKDNNFSEIPVKLILLKNYGTDGDPEEETLLTTFNFSAQETQFSHSFSFGSNSGKVIGPLNDDFVSIVFRLPVDESSNILITDALQENGNNLSPTYPQTTERQDIVVSLGGGFPIPNPDGSNLFLSPVLTRSGWKYDDSAVSSVLWTLVSETPEGYVPFDGETSYPYNGLSVEGIPYKRIADKLWVSASSVYVGGTGNEFVTMQEVSGTPQNLTLAVNAPGAFTVATNGAVSPGFTFTTVHSGNNYGMTSYYSPDWVIVRMNATGTFTPPTAGDSGFTVGNFRNLTGVKGISLIGGVSAPSGLAGKYLTVDSPSTAYYPWFQVDGAGSDPAPGGTGIPINLQSIYSATEVSQHLAASISGQQLVNILFVAASAIPAGSYFNFSCPLGDFYVYYIKDGAGSDPAVPGKIGIKVEIAAADTAAQVASLTLFSANRAYIGMPDGRGKFPRIWDNGAGWDNPTDFRFNSFGLLAGDVIGSYEIDTIIKHSHEYQNTQAPGNFIAGGTSAQLEPSETALTGDEETRPVNINLNAFIKI